MRKTLLFLSKPGKYYPLGFLFLLVFIFGLFMSDALAEKAMTIGPNDQTSRIIMGTAGSKVGIGGDPGSYNLNVNGTLNVSGAITSGVSMNAAINAQYVSSGPFGNLTGGGNYSFPANLTVAGSETTADNYTNGWYRNYARTGIYNQSYGTHLYWNGADTLRLSSNNGMIFNTSSGFDSAIAGYVYHDGSGFGMLNNQGNWMFYSPSNNQNVQFPAWGHWISEAATHRGEGTNYVDYSRYVYNNGAYSGSGWIEPSDLGVRYAGTAGSATNATQLPTDYVGGVQSNPQVYFGVNTGLKVAMTGYPNVWSDTLWINGYAGGDVPWMNALHFIRNGQPRMWISTQRDDSTSYGTAYEIISGYNIASQSVSYANSAGSAPANGGNSDTVDGYHAGGLLKWNTWDSGNYYQTNGDIYMAWAGTWLSSVLGSKLSAGGSPHFANLYVNGGGTFENDSANNSGYFAMNNSSTYWGIMGNYGVNDWRLGYGSPNALSGWSLRWDASGNAWANSSFDVGGYSYANELYTRDNVYLGYMGNWMSNLLNQNVRTDSGPTFGNVYNTGWFRNYARTGIYNQDYGTHFYTDSSAYWRLSSNNGLQLNYSSGYDSGVAGYLYHDGTGFGLLSNRGSWMLYSPANNENVYFPAWGNWISSAATHRGEGTNFIDYAYGMYDAYRGGWRTSNDLYVAYAYSSGNADTVDGYHAGSFFQYQGFTLDANWMGANRSGFTYSVGAPYTGPVVRFDSSNYDLELNGVYYGDGNRLAYRTKNGDANSWNSWHNIYSDVYRPYADSAGSATNATNATNVTGGSVDAGYANVGSIHFYGVGGDSGQPAPSSDYRIYQAPGPWSYPYPDLNIAYHTGISIGAHYSYGGIRFFNNSDMATKTFSVGEGDNNVRVVYDLYVGGNVYANSFQYSDETMKKNIQTIDNPLSKIMQLRGVTFDWKKDNKAGIGVIAQEVEKVYPELVSQTADGTKAVQYSSLVAPLIEAVKAQQGEIEQTKLQQTQKDDAQQKEIDYLKEQIKILQAKIKK